MAPTARLILPQAAAIRKFPRIGVYLRHFLGAQELWTLRAGYQTKLFRSDFSEHYGYARLGRAF